MATPKKYIDDGIVSGVIKANHNFCGHCGESAWCVEVNSITLPEGVKPSTTLIAYHEQINVDNVTVSPIRFLGLTCSCYSKFHRQLAYIQGRKK